MLKAYDSEDRSTDASVKGGTLCLDALAEEAKALADEVNAALQTSADHLETAPTSSATTSAPTSGAASAGHSPNLSRTYEVTPRSRSPLRRASRAAAPPRRRLGFLVLAFPQVTAAPHSGLSPCPVPARALIPPPYYFPVGSFARPRLCVAIV